MMHIDIDRLQSAKLVSDPFEYVVVPSFLKASSLSRVIDSYPDLRGGSYPLEFGHGVADAAGIDRPA